jgi:hypothetical protein
MESGEEVIEGKLYYCGDWKLTMMPLMICWGQSAWCGNSRQGANPAGKRNTGAGTGSKSDAGLRGYTEARNEGACR